MAFTLYGIILIQLTILSILDSQAHVKAQLGHSLQLSKTNMGQLGQILLDDKHVQKHSLLSDQHGLRDNLEYIISFYHVQSQAYD